VPRWRNAAIAFKTVIASAGRLPVMNKPTPYVHGYEPTELARLQDQARTLADLLHGDTTFAPGSRVLEVGCGVGAQTIGLAGRSPGAHFMSIDVSAESLEVARERCRDAGLTNVEFRQADLLALPSEVSGFDHLFVCFVMEHLASPTQALAGLRERLRPEGSITVIEGDHGSVLMHPESAAAREVVECLVYMQERAGGNALIGRQLYPLLAAAGFGRLRVAPRLVYVDASRSELMDGFTRKTFIAMVEGVREHAVRSGLISRQRFDVGIDALHRTTERDGVFCYTFFKATGQKRAV
jgi:SAM-dependent methyltransferase